MGILTPPGPSDRPVQADFCSTDTSFPCDYRLVRVEPHQYARASAAQVWADPDYAHAARQMLMVFDDHAARETIVANARRLAERDYSPKALGARVETRLRDLFDRRGQESHPAAEATSRNTPIAPR